MLCGPAQFPEEAFVLGQGNDQKARCAVLSSAAKLLCPTETRPPMLLRSLEPIPERAATHHSEAGRPGCAEEGLENAGGAPLHGDVAAAARRSAQRSARRDKAVHAGGSTSLEAGA